MGSAEYISIILLNENNYWQLCYNRNSCKYNKINVESKWG